MTTFAASLRSPRCTGRVSVRLPETVAGRFVRFAILVVALAACGDDSNDVDASQHDAAVPPRCARQAAFDEPPPDLVACGICFEPHVRHVNPYFLGGSRIEGIAVPGGIYVVQSGGETGASFVSTSGEVIPLREWPYVDPRPEWGVLSAFGTAVPDTRQLWVHSTFVPQLGLEGVTDAVLYEVDPRTGWRRVAEGRTDLFGDAASTPSGDLVGIVRRTREEDDELIRFRPMPDGTTDVLRRNDILGPDDIPHDSWSLADGNVAILSSRLPRSRDHDEDWLTVIDGDLEPVRPPLRLNDVEQSLYLPDQLPTFHDMAVGYGGERLVLLWGLLVGSPAADQLWVQRLSNMGEPQYPAPGLLTTVEAYPTVPNTFRSGGSHQAWVRALSPVADAVFWYESRDEDIEVRYRAVVFDRDGGLLEPVPRILERDNPSRTFLSALDGRGNSYVAQSSYHPERPLEAQDDFGVLRMDDNLEPVWEEVVYPQDCPTRVAQGGWKFVGAADEGIWVIWQESFWDVAGYRTTVTKITLVQPDGTFAWSNP